MNPTSTLPQAGQRAKNLTRGVLPGNQKSWPYFLLLGGSMPGFSTQPTSLCHWCVLMNSSRSILTFARVSGAAVPFSTGCAWALAARQATATAARSAESLGFFKVITFRLVKERAIPENDSDKLLPSVCQRTWATNSGLCGVTYRRLSRAPEESKLLSLHWPFV